MSSEWKTYLVEGLLSDKATRPVTRGVVVFGQCTAPLDAAGGGDWKMGHPAPVDTSGYQLGALPKPGGWLTLFELRRGITTRGNNSWIKSVPDDDFFFPAANTEDV